MTKENDELHVEIAQKDILYRIQQAEQGEDNVEEPEESSLVMENYQKVQREMESLKLKLAAEHEEETESLQTAKRNLEKKVSWKPIENLLQRACTYIESPVASLMMFEIDYSFLWL